MYIKPEKLQGLIKALAKEGWAVATFRPNSLNPAVYEISIEPLEQEKTAVKGGAADTPCL